MEETLLKTLTKKRKVQINQERQLSGSQITSKSACKRICCIPAQQLLPNFVKRYNLNIDLNFCMFVIRLLQKKIQKMNENKRRAEKYFRQIQPQVDAIIELALMMIDLEELRKMFAHIRWNQDKTYFPRCMLRILKEFHLFIRKILVVDPQYIKKPLLQCFQHFQQFTTSYQSLNSEQRAFLERIGESKKTYEKTYYLHTLPSFLFASSSQITDLVLVLYTLQSKKERIQEIETFLRNQASSFKDTGIGLSAFPILLKKSRSLARKIGILRKGERTIEFHQRVHRQILEKYRRNI